MKENTKERNFVEVVLNLMHKHKLSKVNFMSTNYGMKEFKVLPYSRSMMDFRSYVWQYKDFVEELEKEMAKLFKENIITTFFESVDVDRAYIKIHFQNKFMFSEEVKFIRDEYGLRFVNPNYPPRKP